MRRFASVLSIAGLLLLSVANSADAATLPVSGTFTGTGSFSFGLPCSFIHQVADLDADVSPLGTSTIHLDFCVLNAPPDFPADGTFTLVSTNATLAGTMTGFVQAAGPGPEFPFRFELSVTSGTGSLQGATGTVILDGAFGVAAATAHGTVSGTLQVPSVTPSMKEDCKNDGWRGLVDDHGSAFRNQGQCVQFVVSANPHQ
jgi:hypothetical protein